MRKLLLVCGAILLMISAPAQNERTQFNNLLDLRQSLPMMHVNQTSAMLFADQGAWHAYSLPARSSEYGGFNGPVLFHEIGYVLSGSFARIGLTIGDQPVELSAPVSTYTPGLLTQKYTMNGLSMVQSLIFLDHRAAIIKVEIRNSGKMEKSLGIRIAGEVRDRKLPLQSADRSVTVASKNGVFRSVVISDWNVKTVIKDSSYTTTAGKAIVLGAGRSQVFYLYQAYIPKEDEAAPPVPSVMQMEQAFAKNEIRWNGYIGNILRNKTKWLKQPEYRKLAIKCLVTLITNWRSAAGDIRNDGIFPSYNFFDGFWAWDSWKHAAACALFDTKLAEKNIRSMFDYQDEEGMIADCVFSDSTRNNYRNTKPPLATWAVWEIYLRSHDKQFLQEMYARLIKYHQWWYRNRDRDKNGLCEFGCTNGEAIAAAWESGMDNAVRFDSARLLKNSDRSWTFNQESVDLNSFLYLEKKLLAKIATVLGDKPQVSAFNKEAAALKEKVNRYMFDAATGFYYDIGLDTKRSIGLQGPEGWQPLWTGLASASQANRVAEKMMDTARFNTYLPFPTFQADHPRFDPVAYWRGPVWIDQAMFGIEGLKKYGKIEQADSLFHKLLHHGEGMLDDKPLRETYNPRTGAGMTVPNFGWTAACLLRLLCL
ncbi:MAG: hypothetical protein J7578_12435 [Chitinophagaceae bacterium]|nr:hypothetical protein [Chitinophagaceae bacterium]